METLERRFENAAHRMMIADSSIYVIVIDEPDIKTCMELGAAIYYNKPILVVAPPGKEVPPKLAEIAYEVLPDVDVAESGVAAELGQIIGTMIQKRQGTINAEEGQ